MPTMAIATYCIDVQHAFVPSCCGLTDESQVSTLAACPVGCQPTRYSIGHSVNQTFTRFYAAAWWDPVYAMTRQEILGFTEDFTYGNLFLAGSDPGISERVSLSTMLARGPIQRNTYFNHTTDVAAYREGDTLRWVASIADATDFVFPEPGGWDERRGTYVLDPDEDTLTMNSPASYSDVSSGHAWTDMQTAGILINTVFHRILTMSS
jgi:hypothetical protein